MLLDIPLGFSAMNSIQDVAVPFKSIWVSEISWEEGLDWPRKTAACSRRIDNHVVSEISKLGVDLITARHIALNVALTRKLGLSAK
jgi:hypothetical protein